jgi:hypothetical protein
VCWIFPHHKFELLNYLFLPLSFRRIAQKHRNFWERHSYSTRWAKEYFERIFLLCWAIVKYPASLGVKHHPAKSITELLDINKNCVGTKIRRSVMLHVYLRRSPSPVQGMSTSASASSIRANPSVQPIPSSYSASNLTAGGSATRGQLSPFSLGEPLGEPRHQYRPQRPTRLNVPDNAYCLSCLPAGLNFSAAMTAKQQMPALPREEVSYQI